MPESRKQILTGFLREHQLQGWFSWRPDEVLLQSGHYPHWGLSFLLTLADGDSILFVPEVEPPATLPSEVSVITYPWGNLACPDAFSVLDRSLRLTLGRGGISKAKIGCLRSPGRSSLAAMFAETSCLAAADMARLTAGMADHAALGAKFLALYLHKTGEEIARIRRANQVARMGLDAWRSALLPGTTEAEAAASAEAAVLSQTGRNGIVTSRAWAMVQSGPNTVQAGRFNRSSGRRLESGDLVLIEMATCVDGYWSDLTRTEPVGGPGSRDSDLVLAVRAAQAAALRALGPAKTAQDVDGAARQALRQAGVGDYFTHALGHHVGFRYHDPGFALAPGVFEVLRPGMVVTVEPGVYVPQRQSGARVEDNVAITESGIDVLSAPLESAGGGGPGEGESHD